MSDKGVVLSTVDRGIGIVNFSTPKSNSLPGEILEKLAQAITQFGEDNDIKAILLRSEGEKAFCAGASFDELLEVDRLDRSRIFFSGFANVLNAMKNCGKIVIVRVQGKATGGGVGLICGGDYCFATSTADLALTEINLGIGPFVIGPYVERKIGASHFAAMALDAKFRSAEWALDKGVYHHLSSSIEEMDKNLGVFLEELRSRSSKALALIKKVAWEGTESFNQLTPQRVDMSASLILSDESKSNINKIKEQLASKKKP